MVRLRGQGNRRKKGKADSMTAYKYSGKTIFILGAPRSGTSWLAKIFDAHPDVLYRHEPDILIRAEHIPFMCGEDQVRVHRREAEEWLNALAGSHRLKSAGSLPVFAKSFHTASQSAWRRSFVMVLKLLQQMPLLGRVANSIDVPDLVDLDSDAYKKLVIKSVSSMGRAGLIAAAAPASRIIIIVRHPCGQVASMLRGVHLAKFEHDIPLRELAQTPLAPRFGLTEEKLAAESFAGQLAWSWVIQNETAIEALKTAKHVKLVRHNDLAEQPEPTMRMLFEFCDLDWRPEVADFLTKSTRATGHEGYYDVKRDPIEASTKWRLELSETDIDTITRIASQSEVGQLFFTEEAESAIGARSTHGVDITNRVARPCRAPEGVSFTAFPPQVYLIGAQKAATTTLAEMLNQHPEITLSVPKEPDFFTNNWDQGLDWYRRCFGRLDTLLLDASTTYTMAEIGNPALRASDARAVNVPQRIYQLRPDAKFIYMVRDPAARIFSAYWHDVRERRETRSMRQVIAEDPSYLDPSYYFAQISRYLEYFDLDRFFFLRFEEFVRDPLLHTRRCAEFLGVAPFAFESERVRNESFRYNRLGRLTRDAVGLKWSKRISTSLRTVLPDRVYRSLKGVASQPLPRLGEEDRAWLTCLFQKDYEAFEELIRRWHSEANPAAPSPTSDVSPVAARSQRDIASTMVLDDFAGQAPER